MRVGVLALQLVVVSCFQQNFFHKRKYRNHPNWELLPIEQCGVREEFNTNGSLENGAAGLGQHPWIAALIIKIKGSEEFECGGSVINDRYILTAAHCVHRKSIVKVRLGEHTQSTYVDCTAGKKRCAPPRVNIPVEEVVTHPDYFYTKDQFHARNDIALVRLKERIEFNDYIRPICLPTFTKNQKFDGKFLEVAGWGISSTGRFDDKLQTLKVPVIPQKKCMSLWDDAVTERDLCKTGDEVWCDMDIDEREICAGGIGGKGVRKGYSGGPLMAQVPDYGSVMYIIGVVSYGVDKLDKSSVPPDVYMRVSEYVTWILDTIKD